MKLFRYFLLLWFLMLSLVSNTQEINNIHFEQVGKQIHIYYDLEGGQAYSVQVFCSTDNGQTWGNQLKYVTGDVGRNQRSGYQKKITWDVTLERNNLIGDIIFKVEINQRQFEQLSNNNIISKEQLFKFMEDYHYLISIKNLIELDTKYADTLVRFHSLNNIAKSVAIKDHSNYLNHYDILSVRIIPSSYNLLNENNEFILSYNLDYDIFKISESRELSFLLDVHVVINSDIKIKSIYSNILERN